MAGLEIKKSTISQKCRDATIKAHKNKRSFAWKGGRIKDKNGYIHIWMPEHPNASKSGKGTFRNGLGGYVLEHRFIMANYLGRPLTKDESVHHKNCIKDDNGISNLELMQHRVHKGIIECPYCRKEFSVR